MKWKEAVWKTQERNALARLKQKEAEPVTRIYMILGKAHLHEAASAVDIGTIIEERIQVRWTKNDANLVQVLDDNPISEWRSVSITKS